MVGISGEKTRNIELKKFNDYDVAVFGNWKNWKKYLSMTMKTCIEDYDSWINTMLPEVQWQWRQNFPELIVEDVLWFIRNNPSDALLDHHIRNFVYADLLYRGVNKAFFMRYAFIRYKKLLQLQANELWKKMENANDETELAYLKGYYDATVKYRGDIKTILCSPRYIIWNDDRPGLAADTKISNGWLNLIKQLWSIKFPK